MDYIKSRIYAFLTVLSSIYQGTFYDQIIKIRHIPTIEYNIINSLIVYDYFIDEAYNLLDKDNSVITFIKSSDYTFMSMCGAKEEFLQSYLIKITIIKQLNKNFPVVIKFSYKNENYMGYWNVRENKLITSNEILTKYFKICPRLSIK